MTPTLTPTRTPEPDTRLRDRSMAEIDREFEALVFEPDTGGHWYTGWTLVGWLALAAAFVAAIVLLVVSINDQAPTLDDVSGSDVHLQNIADGLAATVAVPDVLGSDVHLQNLADEAVTTDVTGSDVHLQNLADTLAPDVTGSDVHLQNLADEVTATDVTGSDVHLQNLADEGTTTDVTGSDVHLQHLADEAAPDVSGSDVHLQNQADDLAGQ
jgi:hypothetical protein